VNIHNRVIVSLFAFAFSISGLSQVCFAVQSGEGHEASAEAPKTVDVERQDASEEPAPKRNRPKTKFLRLLTDEYQNPVALQTATANYVLKNEEGEIVLEVFLEGVIHIADASYYRSFQKRFERYDTVLYESILRRETKEADETETPSGFEMLQQLSTGTLGLAYQFDEIDYQANGMLHSDLTLEEIAERMEDRGDDQATLLADLLAHIIQKLNVAGKDDGAGKDSSAATDETEENASPNKKLNPKELLSVFTDPDGIMKIRRMMASALVDSKLLESAFPPSIHKMIIGDRNERAMSVLSKQAEDGKKRIALFFGVGHMADFEERLVCEYGMKLVGVNWRNAWDLRDGAIEGAPLEGLIESTFRDSFKNKLRQFAKGATNKKKDIGAQEKTQNENDAKIEAMEQALKALEAKLKEFEEQAKENDKEADKGNGADSDDKQGDGSN